MGARQDLELQVSQLTFKKNVLTHQGPLVAQWLERYREAMGSILVGDSDFSFVPRSRQVVISSFISFWLQGFRLSISLSC